MLPPKCVYCGHEATTPLTETLGGETRTKYVCEQCRREEGGVDGSAFDEETGYEDGGADDGGE